ncbi:hypothetical protein AYI69_g5904 [Smittium culicis]|uniref:Uncharacterized protein n=1 Tax=Smittium culicis TaxID=133412 RepID=A0A1R1Y2Q0_9FUNG|nr:hypothetical protein AYI69_g10050 [Smittium culicis]OMJ21241.1 hypothetical protein AYI69_g5904 [Smittium culicis]
MGPTNCENPPQDYWRYGSGIGYKHENQNPYPGISCFFCPESSKSAKQSDGPNLIIPISGDFPSSEFTIQIDNVYHLMSY